MNKPDVYQYLDPRKFIADMVEFAKGSDPEFSYRKLSKKLGFMGSGTVHSICTGKRGLSLSAVHKFAAGFGLKTTELKFLELLFKLSIEKSQSDRDILLRQILENKNFSKRHPLAPAQYRYMRNWYVPAIREMISSGATTVTSILEQFIWPISKDEVLSAIEDLTQLQFIHEEHGHYFVTVEHIVTKSIFESDFVESFHLQNLELAKRSLTELPKDKRDLRSATISMSKDEFKALRVYMHNVLLEVVKKFEGNARKRDCTVQLNIQAFALGSK